MAAEQAKVMIVDDDPQILTMLQRLMKFKNIDCVPCSSASEALTVLRSSGSIKLVLLDINMPEMSGLELLEKMIKIVPSIHVIMITGLGDLDVAKKCMELGAKDFITKPFDLDYLQTSILAEIIPML
ncbi:MAG: hypothetical protein A2X49_15270 [Lentisphaerae bacterium GWF2_52_8]|nr:MAG: hypothetical protein A2X49_15270 [Lentisphaerae bacterium GWF2_52_8]